MFQRWLIVNDVGYLGNWDMYSRFINITLSKENMCKRYDVSTFVYFRILCSERLASQRLAPVRFDQLSFNFIDKRSERLIKFQLQLFSSHMNDICCGKGYTYVWYAVGNGIPTCLSHYSLKILFLTTK